ncbi:MAG: hypothetical protein NVS4B3_05170 [Gemmatimonadaceae bacterium]
MTAVERVLSSRACMSVLVLLGIVLRGWAYVRNASLWLDEILLGRNILELPLRELVTQPLQLDQVAPRGFLLAEKLVVVAAGESEFALRLLPFLCSALGVFLFKRLAQRTLDGLAVPFAVALFAIGVPLIRYGAEVKQYGVDATVAIGLVLIALDLRVVDFSRTRLLAIGALGFVITWFSQASVLVMAGIGLALAVQWARFRDGRTARSFLIVIPMWAGASAIALVAGLRSMTPATREFMDDFWKRGFFPLPLRSVADLGWFWTQALSLVASPSLLRYRWPALYLAVALVGLGALWRRRSDVALFVLGPLIVAVAAAVAQQYPFSDRLLLYLVPSVLLAIAAGAESIRRWIDRAQPALGGVVMLALLLPPTAALLDNPPPYDIEHNRSVYGFLQRHRQPGDVVYVFPLVRIGALFYGPSYGLPANEFVTSVCDRNDTRPYVRDVDRFRGVARLWVITSDARPFRVARASVRAYLSAIGVNREALYFPSLVFGTVGIELYDVSNPARLAAANAESFPVPPMPTDPRPGCRAWAGAGGPADRKLSPQRGRITG